MEVQSYSLFIGGTWEPSADSTQFPVINPATEEVIARVSNAGAAEMQAAIHAAVAAQPAWADTPALD